MKKQWLYWYLPLATLACFVCFIQNKGLLNDDVLNGIHLTQQLLAGGNYVTDFFENNPPLVLYLYAPAVLFAKLTHSAIGLCLLFYFTLLAVSSLILSHWLLKQYFKKNLFLTYAVSYIAAYVLLLLPTYQFGQREHLLIILTLPYILVTALRLENTVINPKQALIIGIMAGIGFSIKPFFLATPILIELFLMISTKNIFAWLRIEALAALFIVASYVAYVWCFFPAYHHIVAPLALQFYYAGQKQSWITLFHYFTVLFSLGVLIFYLLIAKSDRYPQLSRVLFLSVVGFIVAFIIPRNAWGYHTLPAVSMAYFLLAFLFSQIILSGLQTKTNYFSLMSLIGFIFILPVLKSFSDQFQLIEIKNKLSGAPFFAFFDKQPVAGTFMCLSPGALTYQPLTQYANAHRVGKFSSLWWEVGYHRLLKNTLDDTKIKQLQERRKSLIDALANDISTQRPQFILVDITSYGTPIDLLSELLAYKNFSAAWKNYAYTDTFTLHSINTAIYQVYARTCLQADCKKME